MTQVDVLYRFGRTPQEQTAMAVGKLREVYGVRLVTLDERARTVRIEYDSTRLSEPVIHQLLRRTRLDVTERVVLFTPPAPKPDAPPAPAA